MQHPVELAAFQQTVWLNATKAWVEAWTGKELRRGRQALSRLGLGRRPDQPRPARRTSRNRRGGRRTARGPAERVQGPSANRVLHPATAERAGPEQLPVAEPGRAQPIHRDQGTKRSGRVPEPAGRPRAWRGPARHRHQRQERLRRRARPGDDAGQGGLPERPDAADPVRAADRNPAQAPAPVRAGLDQQVLHLRHAAEEQPGALHARAAGTASS